MNRRRYVFLGSLMLVLLLAACSAQPATQASKSGAFGEVSPQQLRGMLDAGGVTLVDVHIPEQPHIPGTDAVVPYNDIEALEAALPDKEASIVLYCRSGHMSADAAQALVAAGYTNVSELTGGENAWTAAGYEV